STGVPPEPVATPAPEASVDPSTGQIVVPESSWWSSDGSHQIHQRSDGSMWNESGQRCDAEGNPI
ncbi:MAG TPA: hypothetical protein H9846_02585, partial [Candidatus Gemmiger excrementipullorum]|nr:hypothetical protein [Candidatus Gemmiger excrementipullorum]